MKPPWKFFAQLMSRQRPSDTPGQTIEHDGDPKPGEHELQRVSAPLLAAPETTPDPEQEIKSASPDPVEPTAENASKVDTVSPAPLTAEAKVEKAEAVEKRERPPAEVPAPASKAGDQPAMPREKPLRRGAGKARVHPIAQSPVAAGAEPVPQPAPISANPFFDEAASLDEDIKQLREQLTQKLHLQNAQLRKMLERFERS